MNDKKGRAFILGNGPSLVETPLDQLRGEVTFACNRINLIYEYDNLPAWRPTYYVASDLTTSNRPLMLREMLENIETSQHSFIRARFASDIERKRHKFSWPPKVTYFGVCRDHIGADYNSPNRPMYLHLPELCGFGSTVYISVQIAILLGYNPLYLLGCDLGFEEGKQNHCHPEYDYFNDYPIEGRDDTLRYMHQLIRAETETLGVEVFNATIGGILEAHPRVDIKETL